MVAPERVCQWMHDEDYQGFTFAPRHLLEPFKKEKKQYPWQSGHLLLGDMSLGWPKNKNKQISGELFCYMTHFVVSNHWWHIGGSLVLYTYLDVDFKDSNSTFLTQLLVMSRLEQYLINAL